MTATGPDTSAAEDPSAPAAPHLFSPPAARTQGSIALLWDKPPAWQHVDRYELLLDGKLVGSTSATDYTARDLAPGRMYSACVRAVLRGGAVSAHSEPVRVSTAAAGAVLEVTAFGAIGDGETLNTAAIQTAVDSCPPGGTVRVPRGVFRTGALFLKSDMTLLVDEGGVVLGSGDPADYPEVLCRWEGREVPSYASLVNAGTLGGPPLVNVTIAGRGTIDASGSLLRPRELAEAVGAPGRALAFRNVEGVYLLDVTVRHSPAWCVHFIYCDGVSVNHVQVHTKYDADGIPYPGIVNGDGINPDSSSHVYLFDTLIASQDDCIAVKSGCGTDGRRVNRPSENIRITNCRFRSGFGVAIGSEMSGGVRNVLVRDCTFEGVYSLASVKAPRGRGSVVENVRFEDITYTNHSPEHTDGKWFRGAVNIDQFYSHDLVDARTKAGLDESTPAVRDVTFRRITLETVAGNAIHLTGLPERSLENIRLIDICAVGRYGLKATHVTGLLLENVDVRSREDADYVLRDVTELTVAPRDAGRDH
ncbi:glycoside hydrolase family 28 protein [Streptomyces sp. N2-109]|uniref:Glycoside hydrolase family 28 protein n=1 Tax=Streptomyces gossypii TaxID=2883101 RepID=A0ABT2JUJ2_9ACTN|nr:glycoside hydrolase family 28 protein [Streptomyces gossypii]MCT2591555.1 glycoside hydrolase family 28 protein [Streptomyces gossypii]